MKGERRGAVLPALAVTDLLTVCFLPTERAVWQRLLAFSNRHAAGEESVKKPPSKVFKGGGDS